MTVLNKTSSYKYEYSLYNKNKGVIMTTLILKILLKLLCFSAYPAPAQLSTCTTGASRGCKLIVVSLEISPVLRHFVLLPVFRYKEYIVCMLNIVFFSY